MDRIVKITNEESSSNKFQILTPDQDLVLSNKLIFHIFNNIDNITMDIRMTNDMNRGACLIGDSIFMNGTVQNSISSDNSTYIFVDRHMNCICHNQNISCLMSLQFIITSATNWKVLFNDYNVFYMNKNDIGLTNGASQFKMLFEAIGMRLNNEYYQVTGTDMSNQISTHSIIFNFKKKLKDLVQEKRSTLIGDVPTISIINPTLSDYLVTFLALSFGLFGFISIINKLLFYREMKVDETPSSMELNKHAG